MTEKPTGQIIAFATQKGGVGKTTIALHVAAELARRGHRVIAIDADPQGNLTSLLLDGETIDGMFQLLIVGKQAVNTVLPLRRWNFGLLPGDYRTGEAVAMLAAVGRLPEIPGRIRPLAHVADYVLIDMPPSRGPGFSELLSASDWIIVPTQLERLALEGVGLMAQAAVSIRKEHRLDRPRLLGVVPNMVRANTNEHLAQMQELVESFGATVWPPIPLTVRVAEAASFGTTVYELCPDHDVAAKLRLVVDRLEQNVQEARRG
jgi:chromosome partitioning protein